MKRKKEKRVSEREREREKRWKEKKERKKIESLNSIFLPSFRRRHDLRRFETSKGKSDSWFSKKWLRI